MGLWNLDADFGDDEESEYDAPIEIERILTTFERQALDDAMSGNRLTKPQIELMKDLILTEVLTRYELMILHDVADWLFDE